MKVKHSIKTTVKFFFILCVVVMALFVGGFSIISQKQFFTLAEKDYEATKQEGYETEIKSQVEAVIAILQAEYDKVQSGILTENEAKNEAKEIIRSMRYREDGSGYFWIDDTDYNLVMHPILPDQEGNNRKELKDEDGVMIIQEIMKVANTAEGGGYTEFQLWNFIELYGQHIGMCKPNVIEPLDIVYCGNDKCHSDHAE